MKAASFLNGRTEIRTIYRSRMDIILVNTFLLAGEAEADILVRNLPVALEGAGRATVGGAHLIIVVVEVEVERVELVR